MIPETAFARHGKSCLVWDCKKDRAVGHIYCAECLQRPDLARSDKGMIEAVINEDHHKCANCDIGGHTCWCTDNHGV